jgi:RND family efflux transporter MFP subunit
MKTSVLCLAVTVFVAGCTAERERSDAAAATTKIEAHTAVAAIRELPQTFEAGGVVRARHTAAIVSRIVAEVREVRVRPGDRVKRGDVLVRLDDRDLRAAQGRARASARAAAQAATAANAEWQAAQAGLALARATHDRVSSLHAKNSATPHEFDEAVAGMKAADARRLGAHARVAEAAAGVEAAGSAQREAEVAASFALLTAPFDGIVTQKLIEPGNMAAPGAPLLTIEDAGGFRLEVSLDEARASPVTLGSRVEVELLERQEESVSPPALAGRVAELARTIDPGAHAALVKIDLPSAPGVRSGMFGRARFAGPGHRALAVPAQSIVRRGQLTLVFVVDARDRARMRLVRLSRAAGDHVEVVAGLDAGERIVVDPPASIADGAPIGAPRRSAR